MSKKGNCLRVLYRLFRGAKPTVSLCNIRSWFYCFILCTTVDQVQLFSRILIKILMKIVICNLEIWKTLRIKRFTLFFTECPTWEVNFIISHRYIISLTASKVHLIWLCHLSDSSKYTILFTIWSKLSLKHAQSEIPVITKWFNQKKIKKIGCLLGMLGKIFIIFSLSAQTLRHFMSTNHTNTTQSTVKLTAMSYYASVSEVGIYCNFPALFIPVTVNASLVQFKQTDVWNWHSCVFCKSLFKRNADFFHFPHSLFNPKDKELEKGRRFCMLEYSKHKFCC